MLYGNVLASLETGDAKDIHAFKCLKSQTAGGLQTILKDGSPGKT